MKGNEELLREFMAMSKLDRRYIVFISDDEYKKVVDGSTDRQNGTIADGILSLIVKTPWYYKLPLVSSAVTLSLLAGVVILAINKSKQSKIKIAYLPSSLSDHFILPPAGASSHHVYVMDPVRHNAYHSFDAFHKYVFEYKHMEFYKLLISLGAVRITEKRLKGWGVEIGGDLDASYGADAKVTGKYTSSDKKEKSEESTIIMRKRETEPRIPDDLLWYEYEPSWKEYAEARIVGRCKQRNMKFDYSSDYGVTASVKAEFKDLGLDVGTSFKRYETTIHDVDVVFEDDTVVS